MNIILTYQNEAWSGDIRQCAGWIARWRGKHGAMIAAWAPSRKAAYMRAYRFAKSLEA